MNHQLSHPLKSSGLAIAAVILGCQAAFESPAVDVPNSFATSSQESGSSTAQPDIALRALETAELTQWLNASNSSTALRIRAEKAWGFENLALISEAGPNGASVPLLRVYYPVGSASPAVFRREEGALGGAQFYAETSTHAEELRLSYRVRFSDNFDFVKGGKLPGLFGGEGASGGNIPDGTDGFSTRLMWRRNGKGEVYAYLPTSDRYGTSIGRGRWQFQPGKWTMVEQAVTLNQPGQANGRIQLWIDGRLMVDEAEITFRSVDALQLNGLFFSTFFGGGDASWATPQDVYVDFADFTLR